MIARILRIGRAQRICTMILLFVALRSFDSLTAQDVKIRRGQFCFGDAVAVGDSGIYMGLSLGNDFNSGTDVKIFRFDVNLNPIDSLLLSDVLGSDGSFRHVERMQIDQQGDVWVNVLRRNEFPCLYNRSYLVRLGSDLSFKYGFDLALPSDSGGVYMYDFIIESNSIVAVGVVSKNLCDQLNVNGAIRRYQLLDGTLAEEGTAPTRVFFDLEKMGSDYWVTSKDVTNPTSRNYVFNDHLQPLDSNIFSVDKYSSWGHREITKVNDTLAEVLGHSRLLPSGTPWIVAGYLEVVHWYKNQSAVDFIDTMGYKSAPHLGSVDLVMGSVAGNNPALRWVVMQENIPWHPIYYYAEFLEPMYLYAWDGVQQQLKRRVLLSEKYTTEFREIAELPDGRVLIVQNEFNWIENPSPHHYARLRLIHPEELLALGQDEPFTLPSYTSLKVVPQPTEGRFRIETGATKTLEGQGPWNYYALDPTGRLMEKGIWTGQEFQWEHLAPGLYPIVLKSPEGRAVSFKVLIQ